MPRTHYAYDEYYAHPTTGVVYFKDAVTDGRGHSTTTYKDILGRAVRTVFHDGTSTENLYGTGDPEAPNTLNKFDGTTVTMPESEEVEDGGQYTAKIDQMGRITHYRYDSAGNLTDVWQPAVDDASTPSGDLVHPHWQYEYDARGNQTKQIDSRGKETTFAYDEFSRRVKRTLPADSDGITTNDKETWTYNAYGSVYRHTDFKGQTTEYRYGFTAAEGGRLLEERRFTGEADGTPDEKTVYAYDDLGRQSQVQEYAAGNMTVAARTTNYEYDPVTGIRTAVDSPEGDIAYTYDPETGRMTHASTEHNETEYAYDDLGRLEVVTQSLLNGDVVNLSTTYAYDAVGNLKTVTHRDGATIVSVTAYTYDALNRLTDVLTTDTQDDKLFEQQYELADDGQRESVLEKRYNGTSGTPTSTVRTTWTYDALNRLIGETRDLGDNGQDGTDYVDTYAFDLVGNRVKKVHDGVSDDETIESVFNDRDQLVSIDSAENDEHDAEYLYDANGSTKSVTTDPEGTPVTKNYAWDLRNRMIGLDANGDNDFADNGDVLFGYDHEGTRVHKQELDGDETVYLQDKNNPTGYSQIIEEKDSNDDPLVSYIVGLDVIGQQYDDEDIEFLGYDGHGSVRMVIKDDGTLVEVYDYDAYGNALGFDPTAAETNLLYTGEFFDKTVEQYVLRARFYDAAIGRFTSFDSYEASTVHPNHLHKYIYGASNPTLLVDPSGHFSLTSVAAGAGIGGILSGIDTAIAGGGPREIFFDALIGGVIGAVAAPLATIKYARAVALGVGTALGALGSREAYLDGNSALAIYRGTLTSAGLIAAGASLAKLYAPGGYAQAAAALGNVGRQFRINPTRAGSATNPENVAALKATMLDGTYEYSSPRGVIGGYRSNGEYYIGEGHHRVTAAMEVLIETGNDIPLRTLLANGLWTETSSFKAGSYSWGYGVEVASPIFPLSLTEGSIEDTLLGWDN